MFLTEYPQILGTTFQQLSCLGLWRPDLLHMYFQDMFNPTKIPDLRNRRTQSIQNTVTHLHENKILDGRVSMFEKPTASNLHAHCFNIVLEY